MACVTHAGLDDESNNHDDDNYNDDKQISDIAQRFSLTKLHLV